MRRAWWKSAAAVVAGACAYRLAVRPWQMRWGATDDEVAGGLPGDELIAEPATQVTRAITIEAPPEEVWPWVVQIGADRGGFYSYDRLEDLFGLDIHSAESIVTDWQQRSVGDLVAADARATGGWYVMDIRPNQALVLQVADLRAGRPIRRTERPGWEFLWTFALRPDGVGGTRLLVRERVGFANALVRLLFSPLGPVSFVMTRRMMLGIKARAEAAHRRAGEGRPAPVRFDRRVAR